MVFEAEMLKKGWNSHATCLKSIGPMTPNDTTMNSIMHHNPKCLCGRGENDENGFDLDGNVCTNLGCQRLSPATRGNKA